MVQVAVNTCPVPDATLAVVGEIVHEGTSVAAVKFATTLAAPFISTLQGPAPEHPPPFHPVNVDPDCGVANNVTVAPLV